MSPWPAAGPRQNWAVSSRRWQRPPAAAGEPTSVVEERSPVEVPVVIRRLLTIHDRSSFEGRTLGGSQCQPDMRKLSTPSLHLTHSSWTMPRRGRRDIRSSDHVPGVVDPAAFRHRTRETPSFPFARDRTERPNCGPQALVSFCRKTGENGAGQVRLRQKYGYSVSSITMIDESRAVK